MMMPVPTTCRALTSIRDVLEEQSRVLDAIYSRLAPVRHAVAEVYQAEVLLDDGAYLEGERVVMFLIAREQGDLDIQEVAIKIPVSLIDECDVEALVLWVREHATTLAEMAA